MYKYIIIDLDEKRNLCICNSLIEAEEMILAFKQEDAYEIFCFHLNYDNFKIFSKSIEEAYYYATSSFLNNNNYFISKVIEI